MKNQIQWIKPWEEMPPINPISEGGHSVTVLVYSTKMGLRFASYYPKEDYWYLIGTPHKHQYADPLTIRRWTIIEPPNLKEE